MTLKTPEEYLESIKRDVNLYFFGEKIKEFWKHPIIIPSIYQQGQKRAFKASRKI